MRPLPVADPPLWLWCVPRGAKVATAAGEVVAETLSTGGPLFGIEHARASYRAGEAGRAGRPILLRAHALADGVPHQDTVLLADQTLRLDDAATLRLVEVIDGANVVRIAASTVDWVCLARPTDEPLLVNGLVLLGFAIGEPSSDEPTWVEQVWTRVAHADGGGTVRDLPSGARWATLRASLAERARASGITIIADPATHLRLDDGDVVWPLVDSHACYFTLPPGLTSATLATRSGVPSRYLGVGDDRRLGIAVSGVRVDRRDIPLDHWALRDGWHTPEATWRWTDGSARLLLPHRARELVVTIANPLSGYPL